MIEAGISALAVVLVAVIEAISARERRRMRQEREDFSRWQKEEEARLREQEAAREEMMLLILQSSRAAISLGEATANAIRRGHSNGDMEQALDYAIEVKREQKEFLERAGVHSIMLR